MQSCAAGMAAQNILIHRHIVTTIFLTKKQDAGLDAREGGAKPPRPMDGPSQNHAIFDLPPHLLATITLTRMDFFHPMI
jgi:hypothetical protein